MSIFGSSSDSSIVSSLVESRALEIEYASDDDIFKGDIVVVDETIGLVIDNGKMVRMGGTVYIFIGQDNGLVKAKSALGFYELVNLLDLYCLLAMKSL